MPTLTIKLTDEAEETILRRMKISGETNKSRHVIDGYLNNFDFGNNSIVEIARNLDELGEAAARTNRLLEQLIGMREDKLELTVLASIFIMLHQSVNPAIRTKVDRYIDSATVEDFLKTGSAT